MEAEGISLLGEGDFDERMRTENEPWRRSTVTDGSIRGFDGTELHYYRAMHDHPKGSIVIVHGFCEFWGKYHEVAWYLWQLGFSVYFLEQRCHGRSERLLSDPEMVHVDSFDDYVLDLKCFLDQIVVPERQGKKLFLFAHSMGGAVGALFLEKYPRYFRAAVLCSPMLKFKRRGVPEAAVRIMYRHARIHHLERQISYGQSHFSPVPDFEHSSQLSPARYMYQFRQRQNDRSDQMSAATYGWTCAGIDMEKPVIRRANRVRIPVLLFQAGRDHLVQTESQDAFAKRAGNTELIRYAASKHEVFNATDEIRRDFYERVFRFYNREAARYQ
ncbi:MAG: alpha/beta fold hydrolase [Eubacteriales bacterium]|jgi:lysophospholipase